MGSLPPAGGGGGWGGGGRRAPAAAQRGPMPFRHAVSTNSAHAAAACASCGVLSTDGCTHLQGAGGRGDHAEAHVAACDSRQRLPNLGWIHRDREPLRHSLEVWAAASCGLGLQQIQEMRVRDVAAGRGAPHNEHPAPHRCAVQRRRGGSSVRGGVTEIQSTGSLRTHPRHKGGGGGGSEMGGRLEHEEQKLRVQFVDSEMHCRRVCVAASRVPQRPRRRASHPGVTLRRAKPCRAGSSQCRRVCRPPWAGPALSALEGIAPAPRAEHPPALSTALPGQGAAGSGSRPQAAGLGPQARERA